MRFSAHYLHSPNFMPTPLHLLPPSCRLALVIPSFCLGLLMLIGCSMPRYDLDTSYRDEFRAMVQTYQSEASRIAADDHTIRDRTQAALPADALSDDPLLAHGLRVQEDLPYKNVSLEDFYVRALNNSAQIRVFSELPLIRETGIQEAKGAFDTRVFVESRYDLTNDPVGSTLTTGGPSRLDEDRLSVQAGVRKKVATGAEVYAIQEVTRTDSNSLFFTPNPQASARLRIGAVQPLLHGAGIAYNHSIIHIAEIDSEIARHEFLRQSESHLLEITRTYWALYMARGVHQAKYRSFKEAVSTVAELDSRGDFDAVKRQVLRARAAEAERRASLVRAESAVRNAEDRLKALVNDPEFLQLGAIEMIPTDMPVISPVEVSLSQAAASALENRPEILQAFLQLRAAAVREKMQRNELLPVLNLIVEGYLAGLAEDDMSRAWDNQFNEGGPGAAVGLRFEFPIENNEAIARIDRRKLEMRQLVEQLRATMETVLLEVKVSVREVRTAHRDLQAKYESMIANREDLDDLTRRREILMLGADTPAVGYLEFLIEAQDRQALAEERFLQALATYNVALVTLERAKGNLLNYENISVDRTWDDERDLPRLRLQKEPVTAAAPAPSPAPTFDKSASAEPADSTPFVIVEAATSAPVETVEHMEVPVVEEPAAATSVELPKAAIETSSQPVETVPTVEEPVAATPIEQAQPTKQAQPTVVVNRSEPVRAEQPAIVTTSHPSPSPTPTALGRDSRESTSSSAHSAQTEGFWTDIRNRARRLFR